MSNHIYLTTTKPLLEGRSDLDIYAGSLFFNVTIKIYFNWFTKCDVAFPIKKKESKKKHINMIHSL